MPPSNSFEPDTIPVRAHSRKPAKLKTPAPLAPASMGGAGGGPSFEPDQSSQPSVAPVTRRQTGGSSTLPLLGGAIGGAKGGIPGAYLGGTLAEAARQGIDLGVGSTITAGTPLSGVLSGLMEPQHAPTSGGEALGRIGMAGPEQAAYEIGGRLTAGGVRLGGKLVGKTAYKFAPEAVGVALREGITFTKMGIKKAEKLLGDIGSKTLGNIRRVARGGGGWQSTKVAADQAEMAAAQLLGKQGIRGPDLEELAKLKEQFLKDNGTQMSLERMFEVKKSSGNLARPLHVRVAEGGQVQPISNVQQVWEKEMESFLDHQLGRVVPDYHELNARAAGLIGLKDEMSSARKLDPVAEFVRRASSPAARTITGATIGGGVGAMVPGDRTQNAELGAIIGLLAGNPAAMSTLALFLASPKTRALVGQVPRAVGALAQ